MTNPNMRELRAKAAQMLERAKVIERQARVAEEISQTLWEMELEDD